MTIQRIMQVCLFSGLFFVGLGVSLATFTDLTVSMGADGIVMISLVIGLGLLLLIPSKIYLTLVFFQKESKKKRLAEKQAPDKNTSNSAE